MITIRNLLIFFLLITFTNCNKEEEKNIDSPYHPYALTPYHISANVNNTFVDAAYGYQDPDTIASIYSTSKKYFYISRSDTFSHKWSITG